MVFRTAEDTLFDFLINLRFFVFRHGKCYPHRRHGVNSRQMCVAHVDVGTIRLECRAGVTRHRRSDRAVRKIKFCVFHLSFSIGNCSCRGLKITYCLIQISLAQRFQLRERTNTIQISFCYFMSCKTRIQRCLCFGELYFKGLLVHQKKHIAGVHHAAFGVLSGIQKSVDTTIDFNRSRAFSFCDPGHVRRHIMPCYFDNGNRARASRRRSFFIFIASA